MNLLDLANQQAVIVSSYAAFGSRDEMERYRAMSAMRECGPAANWMLQIAIRQSGQPRVQFAAAIVMHWLGDRQGLSTLIEALKWRLPAEQPIAPSIESAFITIGSPDSITALMAVWKTLPDWGDHEAIRASIYRVCAALRNPIVLPALASSALLSPAMFERHIPMFGELAIPILRQMIQAPDMRIRMLAIQTLRHIPSQSAFCTLAPLLVDSECTVRALVPGALEKTGNRIAATVEIASVVRRGFPSLEALDFLIKTRPDDLCEILTALFENWLPERGAENDLEIVLLALPVLITASADIPRVQAALCKLLKEQKDSKVSLALVDAVDVLNRRSRQQAPDVAQCLNEQLNVPSAAVRARAAAALMRLGDSFPTRIIELLDECRPQGSFVSQLQVILRGGQDAGEAATQAVQNVSKWLARITTDAAESGGGDNPRKTDTSPILEDPRTVPLLCHMLAAVAQLRNTEISVEDVQEKAAFITLILRAMSRIGKPDAIRAWSEIVAVIHLPSIAFAVQGRSPETKCYENAVGAAIETLITLYGSESFGLFLETLYSPRLEVARTGITALEMLGDSRGLPALRAIANNERHPCCTLAAQAIAHIRRTNPEMMSLLRGSTSQGSDPSILLRAARGTTEGDSSSLLRATSD